MRLGRYRLAPPWWGWVIVCLGVAALSSLGVWQIDRGESKQAMLAQRQAAGKSPARDFVAASPASQAAPPEYGVRYTVQGHLDAQHQILFDNQVRNERIGYHVWAPLILADGRRVMIDRGWIPLGPGGRSQPPAPDAPTGELTMTGMWRDLPEPGLRLGGDSACRQQGWPRVLNYPTIQQLRCQYDGPVVDGLLLLDEADPRGFARDWQAQFDQMPPVRHFGYALQWFAMAFAVVVIFLVLNVRRIR